MENITQFFKLLKENKGKLFVAFFSAIVFLFILFPFDDLSDLISSQVSKLSNNSVYVTFDRLKMSLFPTPGVKMDQVYIESIRTPALSASELTITPSVSGLIQQKPYGHVAAKGLLKGDVDLNVGKGTRSDNGVERQRIEVSAKKISLHDLRELANLPVLLKGQLNLQTTALADLTFQEQPDVDVDLTINQFELPPSNVNTPMGPLTLPDLKLTTVELKGRLAAGRFIIETGTIGKPGDELQGTIKGNIGINIINRGGGFTHQIGAYTFDIDLKAKKSFQDRAALFLSFIDGFKSPTTEGSQYKFKVSATNPMMPPSIGAAR
ncbi:type II secretion system protein GspN [Bdellovibrio svalbardensis]|uniref:Type II secretion system protein GspN n=1 Tax=Bdellovibrio svalbardensis TaxID=2972972 RepID=A0ABT6DKQ4_9BACT|nr:type II secretion system protein GspN [Bdellovibrio svalbardensis]MDG0817447.1 type II secretion system protein GspN [Bdellovibrio svalbardensis]